MNDQEKSICIMLLFCLVSFAFGLLIGLAPDNNESQKEIIELNIELTKLQIEKLRVNN